MFKIKTTKPARYLVRPSSGVIGQNNEVSVQVLFTQQLDSPVSTQTKYNCKPQLTNMFCTLKDEEDAIANDKFLVQLTPAPANFSAG